MIESVFILLMSTGLVTFFISLFMDEVGTRFVLHMISLVTWLLIFADSLFISVPGDTSYQEYGVSAFSLLFVFTNLFFLIMLLLPGMQEWMKGRSKWRG